MGTATRALVAIALMGAALTAASGCGSSSKPLTRAELTTKANTICRKVTVKLQAATKKGVSSVQQIAHLAPQLASFEETALMELGKLIPPAELENDWKTFISGAQTLAENTSKLGEYAKANNLKGAKALIKSSTKTQQQMVTIAKRDGLKECEQVA
jgi:ABC-type sugar transport system ATPase subunit